MKRLKEAVSGRPLCVTVCGKCSGPGTFASCCSQETAPSSKPALCKHFPRGRKVFLKTTALVRGEGALTSLCLGCLLSQVRITRAGSPTSAPVAVFGYRRASFPKDSCCTLLCSFPRNYLEILELKQSHGAGGCVRGAVTEASLTLQETSEELIKTSTDLFPR